jgi:hypothetical protein
MRYEIFFVSFNAMTSPQVAFEHYFEKRPLYRTGHGTALYENADTGVSFAFDCTADPVVPPGTLHPWARFMIELLRPSFFPEEATREIEPFIRHFEARVLEAPGTPPVAYSPASFLRHWHDASRREYQQALATAERQRLPLSRMPRRALMAAWQWNYHRRVLQTHEGDGLFVPRIWFLRTNDRMATSVIWPEAMAARVPQVDFVIFSRGAFAADSESLAAGRADVALIPWDEVQPAIHGSAVYDSLSVSWRVTDPAMLEALADRVARAPSTPRLPDVVPLDTVLDDEGFPAPD